MSDAIRLNGMAFYGYHGVTPAERETGRVFEIDCELEVDLSRPATTDRLTDTVNYERVYALIKETVEGSAYSLLEALAHDIARKIVAQFPASRVTLRVRKMMPPIPGHIRHIEVELHRDGRRPTALEP